MAIRNAVDRGLVGPAILTLAVQTADQASFAGKSVLVSSFRNEAPYVLEFVAHHKMLGFDEIIIASNDCTDGTDLILAALDRMGIIRHLVSTPTSADAPQQFAYRLMQSTFPIDTAEWLMVLDSDELLNIHVGEGKLADLIQRQTPETDVCMVNWACFGASGHQRWQNGLSAMTFQHRLFSGHSENGMVKSLTRHPGRWREIGNHHLFAAKTATEFTIGFWAGQWQMTVNSDAMVRGALNFVSPGNNCHRIAQVNHYATRTRDCFELRKSRGSGVSLLGKENRRHVDAYFKRMSSGGRPDQSILRYQPAFLEVYNAIAAQPDVALAVQAGLESYGRAIDQYWQTKD